MITIPCFLVATMQDKYGKVGCCSLLSFIYEKKAVVGMSGKGDQ